MAEDLKKMYRTIMEDHFPGQMEISFVDGDQRQTLFYEKVVWTIDQVQKGLRYGENPGQEAALYKLVNGNLTLGDAQTIQPGQYLVSDIELLQSGKHPGKTNLTDADNALNIIRYFSGTPTAVIVKHNNPCGAAQADSLTDAYIKANLADRVAAFGGCIALNQSVDKATAEAIVQQYAEVVVIWRADWYDFPWGVRCAYRSHIQRIVVMSTFPFNFSSRSRWNRRRSVSLASNRRELLQ